MQLTSDRAAWLTALAVVLTTASIHAAPCGRPDVDFTLPPNEASAVPSNAILAAHYGAPALYDEEPVTLLDANADEVAVEITWDAADATLRAKPQTPLTPGLHQLTWPGLRGTGDAGMGRGKSLQFFVSAEPDAAAPVFEGLIGIDWDLSRDRDPCVDRLEDRFVFELALGTTSDDAGAELLAVQVFETRGPAKRDAAPTRVAQRGMPASRRLEVRRPARAGGTTCFAALVQDSVGNVSGGAEREVCVETQRPPFFEGCSIARGPLRARALSSTYWLFGALALWQFRRRAHARRAPLD